jgi:hypothetical protein
VKAWIAAFPSRKTSFRGSAGWIDSEIAWNSLKVDSPSPTM